MTWTRNQMAARAAQELEEGGSAKLGIGPFPFEENVDPGRIKAGKQTTTEIANTAYSDSAASFGMIRGGQIAMANFGAMEVSGPQIRAATKAAIV